MRRILLIFILWFFLTRTHNLIRARTFNAKYKIANAYKSILRFCVTKSIYRAIQFRSWMLKTRIGEQYVKKCVLPSNAFFSSMFENVFRSPTHIFKGQHWNQCTLPGANKKNWFLWKPILLHFFYFLYQFKCGLTNLESKNWLTILYFYSWIRSFRKLFYGN